MDQKNTIVKCKAYPSCLFNHNGICDNYVITIGEDGKCQCYVETEEVVDSFNELGNINVAPPEDIKRGLRAKGDFLEDGSFNLCSAACYHYDFKGACMYCQLRQEYLGPERLMKPCDLFTKGGSGAIKMKVAEFDKPNKNKSTIKDVVPECDLPVCTWSCKHALRSGPSFNPDLWCEKMKGKPAVGLFCSDYEEEK